MAVQRVATQRGKWHGKKYYFGLHYDLHAGPQDTDLGTRCGEDDLLPMLRLMAPDFVQTDCKGHPGYTSWFSKVPNATVSPGVVKDAMEQWRATTKKLGMPLHCHYSGIFDKAAGAKHPEWCVVGPDGKPAAALEKMCPRGPYLRELLIPQLLELIDRYGVDGFWVDGEIWAVEPCYCPACRAAFTARTEIAEPPVKETDEYWAEWWNFTRESFEEYVTAYCEAVHAHKAGVLVCSNWLQTFRHPGCPKVPTDWISGDNSWVWGMDGSRCEARFLSTRGKPWDIMLWNFYCSHGMGTAESPWVAKPVQMLQQEAAVLLAFGGNVQAYEHPAGLRNGQLIPWRQRRLRDLGRFVKSRRRFCQDTTTIPQVAVLHSEHHLRAIPTGKNLMWNVDTAPVQGAVFSLLEGHFGVDILDEWALLPRLSTFPVVVAPEQDNMPEAMVVALKDYVRNGGRLLLSGANAVARFGEDFLGIAAGSKVEEQKSYHVPAADGATPVFSSHWRLLECTTAKALGALGTTPLLRERLLPHPAASVNKVGRGHVLYIPCNIFRDFNHNRYPLTRAFITEMMHTLAGSLEIEVKAPTCIDVVFRQSGSRKIIHFINRASGLPNLPNSGAIDEIPAVGPINLIVRTSRMPENVRLVFEAGTLDWRYFESRGRGAVAVTVPLVRIHAAVVIK